MLSCKPSGLIETYWYGSHQAWMKSISNHDWAATNALFSHHIIHAVIHHCSDHSEHNLQNQTLYVILCDYSFKMHWILPLSWININLWSNSRFMISAIIFLSTSHYGWIKHWNNIIYYYEIWRTINIFNVLYLFTFQIWIEFKNNTNLDSKFILWKN